MFPLEIDGLRPVERRILVTAYQVAKERFVKSAKVDGYTTGNYHPHGSVYGTIVQLVFNKHLEGQGGWKVKWGIRPTEASDMRYTECRMARKTLDLAFQLIDYVPMVETVADKLQKEPVFLPTMFPMCLLNEEPIQGIGFGYRTHVPCYRLEDLYKRLLFLLKKTKEKPTIKPVTDCKILSLDSVLEGLLTTGKGSIEVQGLIRKEPSHHKIILKSWPPGRSFEALLGKFKSELENQDIGFIDESSKANGGTHIVFEVLKQRNRDEIYEKFLKKLEEAIKGAMSFETIVVDRNLNVRTWSIDEFLLSSYNMFIELNKKMLTAEINKLQGLKDEYKLLEKIRPHLGKHLREREIVVDQIVKALSEETKEDEKTIKDLFSKYRISKLLSLKLDIDAIDKEQADLHNNLTNLQSFVLKQYAGVVK
jgi:DNA gyrase/topoisomerase IV subunit A